MFAPPRFEEKPPPPPVWDSRVVGAIVLSIALVLCLFFVVIMDTQYIEPYNATRAVTQTWRAENPITPSPRRRTPTRTPTRNTDLKAQVEGIAERVGNPNRP